ncbi:MAG: sulfatase [Akkermansiaceae bacterium]|nr:sulfatase [Akkermansiaceae bacterium]
MKILSLTAFVIGLLASPIAAKPNILLICIDDLNTQLPAYGHQHIRTPNIDQLASQGRVFKRHYVQAPTCGVSRFSLLSGLYPPARANNDQTKNYFNQPDAAPSLPHTFKANGYTTVSIGKISHYPGGNAGRNWNDPSKPEIPGAWTRALMPCGPWKTPQAAMHGYAGGKPRIKGKNPVVETTTQSPAYPDDLIAANALTELDQLSKSGKPWLLAVGFIKPHLPFTAPRRFLDLYKDVEFPPIPSPQKPVGPSLWHSSGEFMSYIGPDPRKDSDQALKARKHYAACTSYVDDNVGKLLAALKKNPQAGNTIVVLWGDHGFSLGEKKIWGKHHLYHTALHSPLIIKVPQQKNAGKATEAVVETIDIYPTLCQVAGIALPSHLDGKSLVPTVDDPSADSDGIANSFWAGNKSTITQDSHTIFKKGKPYLKFDLAKDPHEQHNLIK